MFAPIPASRFSTLLVLFAFWVSPLSVSLGFGEAFVPQDHAPLVDGASSLFRTTSTRFGRRCILNGITPRRNDPNRQDEGSSGKGDNDDDQSLFDAEELRRQLDSLFSQGSADTDAPNPPAYTLENILQAVPKDNDSPVTLEKDFPPPILTATDRDRRQTEIRLLQQLRHSEEEAVVVSLLWNLWFNERGGRARKLLEQADEYMNQPTQWTQSETILLNLVAEHGPYFTEPLNRLATLYYLQGKHERSYALCRIVLHHKPWHFGALSGIVMVAMAKNDRTMARYWATRRLPTTSSGNNTDNASSSTVDQPRRAEWVDRAVQVAQHALRQAEERTRRALGKPEEYYSSGSPSVPREDDDGSWQ